MSSSAGHPGAARSMPYAAEATALDSCAGRDRRAGSPRSAHRALAGRGEGRDRRQDGRPRRCSTGSRQREPRRCSPAARSGSPPTSRPRPRRPAVAYAKAQVGDSYVYGAAGPNAFDCSGLTMMAWAQAGVEPAALLGASTLRARRSPESELQPGDLVFYYSPISHVGMYIGNGQIVNAPTRVPASGSPACTTCRTSVRSARLTSATGTGRRPMLGSWLDRSSVVGSPRWWRPSRATCRRVERGLSSPTTSATVPTSTRPRRRRTAAVRRVRGRREALTALVDASTRARDRSGARRACCEQLLGWCDNADDPRSATSRCATSTRALRWSGDDQAARTGRLARVRGARVRLRGLRQRRPAVEAAWSSRRRRRRCRDRLVRRRRRAHSAVADRPVTERRTPGVLVRWPVAPPALPGAGHPRALQDVGACSRTGAGLVVEVPAPGGAGGGPAAPTGPVRQHRGRHHHGGRSLARRHRCGSSSTRPSSASSRTARGPGRDEPRGHPRRHRGDLHLDADLAARGLRRLVALGDAGIPVEVAAGQILDRIREDGPPDACPPVPSSTRRPPGSARPTRRPGWPAGSSAEYGERATGALLPTRSTTGARSPRRSGRARHDQAEFVGAGEPTCAALPGWQLG